MAEPSKGPYRIEQFFGGVVTIVDAEQRIVGDVWPTEADDLRWANAHLLAAAPDLLDACRATLNPTGHTDACAVIRSSGVDRCTNLCARVRAAIDRAEGKGGPGGISLG